LNLSPLDLRSGLGREVLGEVSETTSPPLVALAWQLTRVFSITSPFAPGFRCIGGTVTLHNDEASASGTTEQRATGNGETLHAALVSCLGEAADHLSQFERPSDVDTAASGPDLFAAGWIAQAISNAGKTKAMDWIQAREAVAGHPVLLPADICLRRQHRLRAIEPAGALSSGVSAGPTFEAAAARAVLELCERDAAALWWLGGRPPWNFPAGHPAEETGCALLERLRQGETSRRSLLLDITTDLAVPAVAAVSVDRDGRGMACGLAARQGWEEAARAAILEMCQMELAAPVALVKRAELGEMRLNETDRRHLRRAAFSAADCDLLRPRESSHLSRPLPPPDFEGLIGWLRDHAIRVFLVDLTRQDISVPVVRAVSPDLQPFSSSVSTERYASLVYRTGGGNGATLGTPLL
jgi:ribosomal protein S12 methylthiotransferase accessory factor